MVVDRRFIQRLLGEIEDHVVLLELERSSGRELFMADRIRRYGAQYALQACVEGILAIAHHLIAEVGFPTPDRQLDTLTILSREGVIMDPGLIERLPRMVRFRNLLVHRYWQVEPEIVWEVMAGNLDDLRQFCVQVSAFLRANPSL